MEKDKQQNGGAQAPAAAVQEFKIPEGDKYLFVRMDSKHELSMLMSDPVSVFLLYQWAGAWLEENILRPSVKQQQQPQVAIPAGLDLGSIGRMKKQFGRG